MEFGEAEVVGGNFKVTWQLHLHWCFVGLKTTPSTGEYIFPNVLSVYIYTYIIIYNYIYVHLSEREVIQVYS